MAVFNEPTQWDHELGNNADVSTLPDDTSATTGEASLQKLFQIINQTPLEAGGVAPSREDFNALFKFLGDSIFYMQNGGLWSYNSAFDYAVGRVVLYTDGNLYKCILANGASSTVVAPTNTTYWVKVATLADYANFADIDLSNLSQTGLTKIIPTSTILPFAGSIVPDGFLLCNGPAVSRTTYANLFLKIGTTFGGGDGSTTFNIPDLRDRCIIGANTNALGTYIAEQLPNITGYYYASTSVAQVESSGAFSTSLTGATKPSVASGSGDVKLDFNASWSNAIYTDSGKVYPLSLALNFIIKT